MRILTALLFTTALSATASAQHWRDPANLPQNRQPQTEARYQPRNQLADVRLDAGRGRAVIPLPRTGRPLDYLELRAGRVPLSLVDIEVRFADGTSIRTGDRGLVEPFEGRVVNLPRRSARVTAITAHYQTVGYRRAPARLQIFGVREHRDYRAERDYRRDRRWVR